MALRRCDETGVWPIQADGTRAAQLVSVGGAPAWSPDGRKVVLELNGGLSMFAGEGGNPGVRLLAHGSQPAWQPAAETSATRSDNPRIRLVPPGLERARMHVFRLTNLGC